MTENSYTYQYHNFYNLALASAIFTRLPFYAVGSEEFKVVQKVLDLFFELSQSKEWERGFLLELDKINPQNPLLKTQLDTLKEDVVALTVSDQKEHTFYELVSSFPKYESTVDYVIDNLKDEYSDSEIQVLKKEVLSTTGFKDILFSQKFDNTQMASLLMSIEYRVTYFKQILLERNDPLNLKNIILAVGVNAMGYRFDDNIFFAESDLDIETLLGRWVYRQIIAQGNDALMTEFVKHIFKKDEMQDKITYLRVFSEYLEDCRSLLINSDLSETKEGQIIESILRVTQPFLETTDLYENNADKGLSYFNEWFQEFEFETKDFNMDLYLSRNPAFKREIFTIALTFKYILLNQYKYGFWKDLLILEMMIKFYLHEDLSFEELDELVFDTFNSRENFSQFVKISQKMLLQEMTRSSIIGALRYYSKGSYHFDGFDKPYFITDCQKEIRFWERYIQELNLGA